MDNANSTKIVKLKNISKGITGFNSFQHSSWKEWGRNELLHVNN